MAFPDLIAAELLAHEHLQQRGADRLDGRIRQQQLDIAAAILHVDAQAHQNRGVGRPARSRQSADWSPSRSMLNLTGDSGLNASSASASTTSIMRLTRLVSIVV